MTEQMLAEVFSLAWRAELRRLAEAAGGETWTWHLTSIWRGDVAEQLDHYDETGLEEDWPYSSEAGIEGFAVFHGDPCRDVDGQYVAAACPAVVLQLLDAIARVEAQLEEWDRLSKGETPTTARIRAAINGAHTHPVPSGALHKPEDT